MIANSMLQDESLSFRARGVLASILSRPPGWRTNSEMLAQQGREGRDAIRTALTELERAGYLRRTKERNADGTFASVSEVSDAPMSNEEQAAQGDVEQAFDPAPGNPAVDNQAVTTKTENKDISSSPSVSPEAPVEEKISDEEEAPAEAQAPASPPGHDERELLSERYEHREWMPNGEEVKEIRERFIEHDLSKETLRRETNAYIKWMSDRGKAPHSRGWRDWMVRYYRRIIDQNLKMLGVDVQSYRPSELTQEEREALGNEVRNASEQMEGGPDDPGR
jgi:hypothetical protein